MQSHRGSASGSGYVSNILSIIDYTYKKPSANVAAICNF